MMLSCLSILSAVASNCMSRYELTPVNAMSTGVHFCSAVMLLFFKCSTELSEEAVLCIQVQLAELFARSSSLFLLTLAHLLWDLS